MFARSIIAVVVALYAQSALASANCTRSYTVASGDTCDGISQARNVSTYQLAVINPTIDSGCSNLEIGQTLCLGTAAADCHATHTVVANDVCYSVIDTYGINSTMLYANNPQIDAGCSNLYIGEVVCVENVYNVPSLAPGQSKPTTPSGAVPANPAAKVTPTSSSAVPTPTPTPDENEDDLPWCEDGDDGY